MPKCRMVFLLFIFVFGFGLAVNATSWVMLKPEEVVSRAESVVVGKYDFSSEPVKGEHQIFQGYDFDVQEIYKGPNIATPLKVGLDMYDFGWVKEFQQQGGTFLLFLENAGDEFMVPVGGPNGMIQLKNGKVHIEDQDRRLFFEKYVKEHEKAASNVESGFSTKSASERDLKDTPGLKRYLVPIALFVLAGAIILFGMKKIRAK
ncbi:hypothetical protein [Bacillus sp. FJAT-27245]|uniref:hypothetical protein n=1 Tax=Bacillus sp. FJAT-27245 TaxID=1684144 RepID=UPI0006A78BE0|nr:hypothetical protein [Bacillus sp. FJAT-27245]